MTHNLAGQFSIDAPSAYVRGRGRRAVCPSGPSKYVRTRLDERLWKIARLKPVFLCFCPSICDFGHIQRVIVLFGTVNQCLNK